MTKKTIYTSKPVYIDSLTLSEAASALLKLKDEVGDVRLNIDPYEDYGSPSVDVYVSVPREETDEEYKARLKKEEQTSVWERQQYERLKAKFEGNK